MAWTEWSLLATPNEWFCGDLTYTGASCYELGTGGPRGGKIQIHYVGETTHEKSRLSCYGRSGSHIAELIDDHLKHGWAIWFRAMAMPDKAAAVRMQNNLFGKVPLRLEHHPQRRLTEVESGLPFVTSLPAVFKF